MTPPIFSVGRRIGVAVVLLVAALVVVVRFQESRPVLLVMGAGSEAGEGFQLARAISQVVNRHHPRITINVVATQGSTQNAELLQAGRLDLAMLQADVPTTANTRLIAPLYTDAYQLLARNGSGIRSFGDLRGRTVALPPAGNAGFRSFWSVANHFGIRTDHIRAVTMTAEAAAWALKSGAVDATFEVRPPGSQVVRRAIEAEAGYVVPIDQAAAIQLRFPSVEPGRIPKGSYRGEPPLPETDLPTAVVWSLLATRRDLPPKVAQAITEVLFERRRELAELSPLAGFIRAPDLTEGTFMPLHEGAERYYARSEPSMLQENAELIALLVSILAVGGSALFRVADQGRRRRLEGYNADVLAVYREAQACDDLAEVATKREDLLRVLARVLDDAEEGRVTEEGFQMFSLAWQAVDGNLRDRLVLGSAPRDPEQGS